ncbi:MAG: ABC transporter substrate-binding protein [Verrucomicrobia bacterium]|nr:ABC transporter substrate-binding protein [Verrucomicrobiota bacterium]
MKTHSTLRLLLLICLPLTSNPLVASDESEARDFMEKELNLVVETVKNKNLSPDAKRAMVERQIRKHIALGQMAVSSLGSQAAKFNLQEFADYSKEFQEHLLNFYLLRAATFVGDEVKVNLAVFDPDSGAIIVKTMGTEEAGLFRSSASSSSHRAAVDYHLIKNKDTWHITDIVIDGININSNFHSQFRALLKRRTPEEVIQIIREKNAQKEKLNPFK